MPSIYNMMIAHWTGHHIGQVILTDAQIAVNSYMGTAVWSGLFLFSATLPLTHISCRWSPPGNDRKWAVSERMLVNRFPLYLLTFPCLPDTPAQTVRESQATPPPLLQFTGRPPLTAGHRASPTRQSRKQPSIDAPVFPPNPGHGSLVIPVGGSWVILRHVAKDPPRMVSQREVITLEGRDTGMGRGTDAGMKPPYYLHGVRLTIRGKPRLLGSYRTITRIGDTFHLISSIGPF